MIANFKDCFLTVTHQVEFTELPYAARATRFKAKVGIRIWLNGTNNRMLIPIIVEGETDLECRDPFNMIKEFDQYYPYYSLSTRKKLETTYGITSYDIGGLTDAIMELEEDVLHVVISAWSRIFIDDDSSSDSRITDSRPPLFGGKTIKDDSLFKSFSTTIQNEHGAPVCFTIYVYIEEDSPTDIGYYGKIYGLGQKYQVTISPNRLYISTEGGRLITMDDICEELEMDQDYFWRAINEVYNKTEEYISKKKGLLKDSSLSIKAKDALSLRSRILNNKNRYVFIDIYNYKFFGKNDEYWSFYGTIKGDNDKLYYFNWRARFNCDFEDKYSRLTNIESVCKDLGVKKVSLEVAINKLCEESKPKIIKDFYFG